MEARVFDDLPTRIGAPIQDLDYGTDLTAKEARRMDKVHQYAICAGKRKRASRRGCVGRGSGEAR